MFWKRIHSDPYAPFARQWHDSDLEVDSSADREEELLAQDVRAYLANRFRLVFEFATLGAYDQDPSASPLESERKHSQEHRHSEEHRQPADERGAALPGPRACAASRPRSATPGRNVAPTSAACTARSAHSCGAAAPDGLSARPRPRDRSRRPAAKAPEQPCTWLG